MFEQTVKYWAGHVILSNASPVGNAFLPPVVGWEALGVTAVTHLIAYTGSNGR